MDAYVMMMVGMLFFVGTIAGILGVLGRIDEN